MTREDAIKCVSDPRHPNTPCTADTRGVFVESMCDEDIEMYAPEYVREAYAKLTDEQKARFCSALMDQMFELFEVGDNWGFGELMRETIQCIEDDGDDVMELAEVRE
jgi:hypothetical protein